MTATLTYPLTAFPNASFEAHRLMQDINSALLGEYHCHSVSVNTETLMVTFEFAALPISTTWIDRVISEHIPEIETLPLKHLLQTHLKEFERIYPRHYWVLERLFDWELQSEIRQSIKDGSITQETMDYLWDRADFLEKKLTELRNERRSTK